MHATPSRQITVYILCTLLFLACGLSRATPVMTVCRCLEAPVIDGRLDDACWHNAAAATPFVDAATGGLPTEPTHAFICWDETTLYVGFRAQESLLEPSLNMMHRVTAEKTGRDAALFSEDCVELFLRPGTGDTYHFAANSGSGTYEGIGTTADWNADWHSAAWRGPGFYSVEMAIPFAAMEAQPTGAWTMNLTRTRPQANEWSTWAGLQGRFHQPDQFGRLRFAVDGCRLGASQITPAEGRVSATAEVLPTTHNSAVLTLTASTGTQESNTQTHGAGRQQLSLNLPPGEIAAGTVVLALHDGDTLVAASAPLPLRRRQTAASLALDTHNAHCSVQLNGRLISPTQGRYQLPLEPGFNILALTGTAKGSAPRILADLRAAGRPLFNRWAVRAEPPPKTWLREIPAADGWQLVAGKPTRSLVARLFRRGGFWSVPDAAACYAVTVIYQGETAPQFFPKTTTFSLPRGSRQLLRPYLQMDPAMPTDGYRMLVEMPRGVGFDAMEPALCGSQAEVTEVGQLRIDGTDLLRYEVDFHELPGHGMELSMRWGDSNGQTLAYQPVLTAGGTTDWRRLSATVTAPDHAASAHPLLIKWQKRRITGTFWVDNVVFRQEGTDNNLLRMGTFDEPTWKRSFPAEGADGSRCLKIVSTADIADRQQACWVDETDVVPVVPGTRYVVELDVKCDALGSETIRPHFGLLFKGAKGMPTSEAPIYTYATSRDGLICGLPQRSVLRPLPPLRNVRPRRARICPCYYGPQFGNPAVEQAYAENCWASGMTWTYGRVSNGVVPELLPRGHQVFLSIPWHAWAATASTRGLLAEHEEWQALDFKGKRLPQTVCPTFMLSPEGRVFLDPLEAWLLEMVNTQPYAGANWDLEQPVIDPPSFCTCPRCLDRFRQGADLAPDTPLTPDSLLTTFPQEWTDFRCAQNAAMAGRLKAMLGRAARPIEFSMYSGYQEKRTREHYGVDWKLLAPHLDLAIAGYNGGKAQIQATLDALDGVPFMGGEMWYLSDRSDARPPPRMETWRNRILRQYVQSGCTGCLIWYLPTMDGGAFYATSEASELIATYERFFRAEQRCDDRVSVTGMPPGNWAAFEHEGQMLLLLLNFEAETRPISVTVDEVTLVREVPAFAADPVLIK